MNKEQIANICEKLYMYCVSQIPQIENNKLIWFMNGSTLCNMLYNVEYIDDKEVSKDFKDYCYDFIRQPKGDIDITYIPDRRYEFDLSNENIKNFQKISEEQRTYNFVDSNSELNEEEYLFLYKFKEFLAIFNKEILDGNYDEINKKKKNMLNDVKTLFNISVSYCGYEETLEVIDRLPRISNYLHELHEKDINEYKKLLSIAINLLTNEDKINK